MAPADDRLTLLLRTLREQVATASPGWTDQNASDPGVTLISLLAYLAEQLGSRAAELPASSRAEVARIGLQLARLDPGHATAAPDAVVPQLERPNYFSGKLLTTDDLNLEQAYVREKFRRLHLASFDTGIIAGLNVTVDNSGGTAVIVVSPGSALDAQGELIVLDGEVRCPVPPLSGDGVVLLRYVERALASVPAGIDPDGDGSLVSLPSRIAEGAAISIADGPDEGAVLLARLTRAGEGWSAAGPVAAAE